MALAVEVPVGGALVDAGGFGWDHRLGATGRDGRQDRVRVIGLVGDHRGGRDAVEQGQGLRRVALHSLDSLGMRDPDEPFILRHRLSAHPA